MSQLSGTLITQNGKVSFFLCPSAENKLTPYVRKKRNWRLSSHPHFARAVSSFQRLILKFGWKLFTFHPQNHKIMHMLFFSNNLIICIYLFVLFDFLDNITVEYSKICCNVYIHILYDYYSYFISGLFTADQMKA